jgi:hypothetical protein
MATFSFLSPVRLPFRHTGNIGRQLLEAENNARTP